MVVYALCIVYHPEFKKDIINLRKLMNLSELGSEDFKEVIEYRLKLNQDFEEQFDFLMKKYRLSQNWKYSVQSYVIDGYLTLPEPLKRIELVDPFNRVDRFVTNYAAKKNLKDGTIEFLYEEEDEELRKMWSESLDTDFDSEGYSYIHTAMGNGFPVILINKRISNRNQLIQWVKVNWSKNIKPAVSSLPEDKFIKVDLEKFVIGLWSYLLFEERSTWSYVTSKIMEIENKDENFFSTDGVDKLDEQYLIDAKHSAIEYLNQFYPLK
jgi:hypothetical protein